MKLQSVLTAVAVFFTAVVVLLAVMYFMFWQPVGGMSGGGNERKTVGEQAAWVRQYMLRELRSLAREGDGVRVVSAQPGRPILYRLATDSKDSEYRRGDSALLAAGDVMLNPDYHGGQAYTIRTVLPDRIVVDYLSSHCMNGCSTDTGSVELGYRTSSPLRTENVNAEVITKQIEPQIKSLQPAADGARVEIVTAGPQNFSVRSTEVSHRMDRKNVDSIALAVGDGIFLEKPGKWSVVSVKEILPGKVVFEYRAVFDYNGMEGEDSGSFALAYRK